MYGIEFRKAWMVEFFGSLRQVSRILKVSISTLSRWSNQLNPQKRRNGPRKASDALIEIIRIFMRANPTSTCPHVVKHVLEMTGMRISRQLVHLILKKRLGLTWGITQENAKKRKEQAQRWLRLPLFFPIIRGCNIVKISRSHWRKRVWSKKHRNLCILA